MDKTSYDKEIMSRFKGRVIENKIWFLLLVIANIIGFVLLYIYFKVVQGRDYAIQNIFQELSNYIILEGILLIAYIFYAIFHEIPFEIYTEQQRTISERLPEQLALEIERTPYAIFTNDGRRHNVAALLIKSLEDKKILELRAIINFEHFYFDSKRAHVSQTGYSLNALLFWNNEKLPEKEIELRPDTPRILVICELLKGKRSDGKSVEIALMASDPVPTSTDFSEESVFQTKIMFQGKLEGEYKFKTYYYEAVLYAKPENSRILFLDDAEKSYPDIPKKLLERSKSVIYYMKKKKTATLKNRAF